MPCSQSKRSAIEEEKALDEVISIEKNVLGVTEIRESGSA